MKYSILVTLRGERGYLAAGTKTSGAPLLTGTRKIALEMDAEQAIAMQRAWSGQFDTVEIVDSHENLAEQLSERDVTVVASLVGGDPKSETFHEILQSCPVQENTGYRSCAEAYLRAALGRL